VPPSSSTTRSSLSRYPLSRFVFSSFTTADMKALKAVQSCGSGRNFGYCYHCERGLLLSSLKACAVGGFQVGNTTNQKSTGTYGSGGAFTESITSAPSLTFTHVPGIVPVLMNPYSPANPCLLVIVFTIPFSHLATDNSQYPYRSWTCTCSSTTSSSSSWRRTSPRPCARTSPGTSLWLALRRQIRVRARSPPRPCPHARTRSGAHSSTVPV
jgi:hypothetical protein